jgi:hypothetical protein
MRFYLIISECSSKIVETKKVIIAIKAQKSVSKTLELTRLRGKIICNKFTMLYIMKIEL